MERSEKEKIIAYASLSFFSHLLVPLLIGKKERGECKESENFGGMQEREKKERTKDTPIN